MWVAVAGALAAGGLALFGLAGWGGSQTAEDPDGASERSTAEAEAAALLEAGPTLASNPSASTPRPASPAAGSASATATTDRLTGRVLDAEEKPIVGARVRALQGAETVASTVTDATGAYTLQVPPGDVLLEVSAAGFAPIHVPPSKTGGDAKVTLKALVTTRGRVVDAATGAGIAGAPVFRMRPADFHQSSSTVRTDADGHFELATEPDVDLRLQVGRTYLDAFVQEADAYLPTRVERVRAGTQDVLVRVERGLTMSGTLVGSDDEPLAQSVKIEALGRNADGSGDFTRRRAVFAHGERWWLPGLAPGLYDLVVTPDAAASEDARRVVYGTTRFEGLQAGADDIVLRLQAGRLLTGRLADELGQPVTGPGWVYVYLSHAGAPARVVAQVKIAEHASTFELGPLPAQQGYEIQSHGFAGRMRGRLPDVRPGDPNVVLVLAKGARIRGRVVDAEGRSAPAGVSVGGYAPSLPPAADGARAFTSTDAAGTFVLDGLAAVPMNLQAGGATTPYLGEERIGVQPGAEDVTLVVREGVEIRGVLEDLHGQPVATTSLQADDGTRRAAMRPYAQVGPDGRFTLRGLQPGRVRLQARRGDAWQDLGEVDAPATDLRVTVRDP
jgi:hypothetical protein